MFDHTQVRQLAGSVDTEGYDDAANGSRATFRYSTRALQYDRITKKLYMLTPDGLRVMDPHIPTFPVQAYAYNSELTGLNVSGLSTMSIDNQGRMYWVPAALRVNGSVVLLTEKEVGCYP